MLPRAEPAAGSLLRTFLLACALLAVLCGCAQTSPYRTVLVQPGEAHCPADTAHALAGCTNVTPESGDGYELHFAEFDDQGWAAAGLDTSRLPAAGRAPTQTDHLMSRLTELLEQDKYLNIIVYVHGWTHAADSADEDVKRFRKILASHAASNQEAGIRHTVGIFIGWRGKSWTLPGIERLSFWSRKGAALRVSHGAVQELFARLSTIQNFYNTTFESPRCTRPNPAHLNTGGCRVRTLMIGHSFGAWILYSAMSAKIIAALNGERDIAGKANLRSGALLRPNTAEPETVSPRRPADMIVLINPAFEAVRYEPVHRAAIDHRSSIAQPPLLVMISSSGDMATRTFFPIGRFINSIFQRSNTSPRQARAMVRTPGNVDLYQTHVLTLLDAEPCTGWKPLRELRPGESRQILVRNKELEAAMNARFHEKTVAGVLPAAPWERESCGGLRLSLLQGTEPDHNRAPSTLVWNVRADKMIIPTHSDIVEWQFMEFVRQLYGDRN